MAQSPATRPRVTLFRSPSDALTRRQAATASALLTIIIALAWVLTVQQSRTMGDEMTGTMGFGFVGFLAMWVLMVVAMMFPTVGPSAVIAVTADEAEAEKKGRLLRLAVRGGTFLFGYLLVWALFGALMYLVAAGLDSVVGLTDQQAGWLAAAIYAGAGIYQFTPAKTACRDRCRSPKCRFDSKSSSGTFLETARVAVAHGLYCVGCCWAYMVVLIAVGLTNLIAMAILTVVIFIERHNPRHPTFLSRAVGGALLIVAAFTPFVSWLHPGLIDGSMTM
jgi:predicted metal-binding membrane protein